jgi:hypothetical protein
MTNAIVPTEKTWEMISAIAPTIYAARLFGVSSPEQAAAIMLKGAELGLSLTASFEFVQVILGKPALIPRGALALILRSPECAGIEITEQPDSCSVTMKRRNGFQYTAIFTLDDAKRAGLVKPDSGWVKYPANMLRWRAIGFCADVVFPDVIGGMKRADELGADITPEGDVIDSPWKIVSETPKLTLDNLVDLFGAENVLEANGGAIPGTLEEIERVFEILQVSEVPNEIDNDR